MTADDDVSSPPADGEERTSQTASQGIVLPRLPQLARRPPQITWRSAGGQLQRSVEGLLVVGAASESDVLIEGDPKVSRLHGELELRSDGVWITDVGSRNGTYVDGVRVQSARLHHGARVRVGDTEIEVSYDATPRAVELWPIDRFGPILGRSTAMRELFSWLDRAARSDATLLIEGETGTGKELVATAVHEASPRGHKPLSIIDCAALTETLLEAELFGHAKGAFTGAHVARAGAIEAADGGTVFIDEVGELPLALQPKLLRALESRTVRRIGENEQRKVDVRFVTATHRDLRSMVNEGTFREDLYFRLAVLKVRVPALRERADDVALLAEHFMGGDALGPELAREIAQRPWRGNVRELRNFVERAMAFGAEQALASADELGGPAEPSAATEAPYHAARAAVLARFEREYVAGLLARHPGNIAGAARAAGLTRAYLYQLIEKHGLRARG